MFTRACFFLAAAVIGAGAAPAAGQTSKTPGLTELSRSFENLAEKVSPSVVQVFVTGYALPGTDEQIAGTDPVIERGSGSGVIVSPDGYVVTNAHVIENATRIEVELPFAASGGPPGRSILGRRGRATSSRR